MSYGNRYKDITANAVNGEPIVIGLNSQNDGAQWLCRAYRDNHWNTIKLPEIEQQNDIATVKIKPEDIQRIAEAMRIQICTEREGLDQLHYPQTPMRDDFEHE